MSISMSFFFCKQEHCLFLLLSATEEEGCIAFVNGHAIFLPFYTLNKRGNIKVIKIWILKIGNRRYTQR